MEKKRAQADDLAELQAKSLRGRARCPAAEAFISFSGLFISELFSIGF